MWELLVIKQLFSVYVEEPYCVNVLNWLDFYPPSLLYSACLMVCKYCIISVDAHSDIFVMPLYHTKRSWGLFLANLYSNIIRVILKIYCTETFEWWIYDTTDLGRGGRNSQVYSEISKIRYILAKKLLIAIISHYWKICSHPDEFCSLWNHASITAHQCIQHSHFFSTQIDVIWRYSSLEWNCVKQTL